MSRTTQVRALVAQLLLRSCRFPSIEELEKQGLTLEKVQAEYLSNNKVSDGLDAVAALCHTGDTTAQLSAIMTATRKLLDDLGLATAGDGQMLRFIGELTALYTQPDPDSRRRELRIRLCQLIVPVIEPFVTLHDNGGQHLDDLLEQINICIQGLENQQGVSQLATKLSVAVVYTMTKLGASMNDIGDLNPVFGEIRRLLTAP